MEELCCMLSQHMFSIPPRNKRKRGDNSARDDQSWWLDDRRAVNSKVCLSALRFPYFHEFCTQRAALLFGSCHSLLLPRALPCAADKC